MALRLTAPAGLALLIVAIGTVAIGTVALPASPFQSRSPSPARAARAAPRLSASLSILDSTIPELRAALDAHKVTSTELVTQYLSRIGLYEPTLHAALIVNPHALLEAGERDQERQAGRGRGPLHGIPIALKDNIHTTNLPTTGGALVFDRFMPPYEATLTRNLREAGAIIIAKTGMTELANWVAGAPTPMPGNYNAVGRFGFNPYDPRRDPRPATFDGRPALGTGGSSSGIGTAAGFWAGNVGTETSGSVLSPASQNMLAAIKPTVGRISRYGVIPITADQDTPGPMAKSVTDVAVMFGALEGAAPDPNDPATRTCQPPPGRDYTRFLDAGGLKGARIGVPRAFFYDRYTVPGSIQPRGGLTPDQATAMAQAVAVLRAQGAVVVDPADIPSIVDPDPAQNFLLWNVCSGGDEGRGHDEGCSVAFKYGMKRDFNLWLRSLGPSAPVKTLSELRAWNTARAEAGAIKYGQSNLDVSDEMDLERDRARYDADRVKDVRLSAAHGIDEVMKAQRLDALMFPGASGAGLAARPGYPTVIVPFALVANSPTPPFPSGFNARSSPFGVSFTGSACSEPRLITIAYAFEQATKRRVPPPSTP
jgi:amidase